MKLLVVLRTLLVAAWALSVAGPVAGPVAAQSGAVATFQTASLSSETAAGDAHDFQVEIAKTGEQRAQGLMFRRQMAAEAGMLFLFGGSKVRAVWMRTTLLPLALLFIEGRGKIVRTEERTVPPPARASVRGGPVSAGPVGGGGWGGRG